MISPRRVAFFVTLGLLTVASSRASATAHVGLDPFKAGAGARASNAFDPFRVADAEAAPVSTPASIPAASTPTPASTPAAPRPRACSSDAQCPDETICEQSVCSPVPSSINIAYLFYRDGAFREIFGLYWSKRGASGYTVFAPFYWHTWSPTGRTHVVAPLVWRFEDYKERNVLWLGLPLFVSSANPDRSFTWVLPLNFLWREKDAKHQLVIPFFYRTTSKDGGSFYSWFGYSAKDGPRTDGAALWLWWFGEDRKAHTGYNVVFPIVWDFSSKGERATVVFPLFWRFGGGASTTTVLGPWVSVRRPTWSFDTVLPLWWSGRDTKAGTAFKMLLPLFYWQSRDDGKRELWLSPLIGGWSRDDEARSRTLTLLPLLSFWRHDPDHTIRIFTPLYVHSRSELADSTTNWLGLLLFYRRDDPRGSTMAVTPLFWRFHDAETNASATALLPFFARRDGPRDTTTFAGVFPLGVYWRSFKNGGWSGGLFPLAFFGENAGRSHGVVFPLFWRTAGAHDATTVAAPFVYWHHDPRGSAGGVPLALIFWGERAGESYAVQFPLFWHFANAPDRTSTTVLPFGYLHRDADGWSLGAGPLLPILWIRSGQTRSHFVLFPIVWHFRDAKEDRSTTVVGPYWHRSWGDETTDALFPLLHWRRGARPGGTDETSFTLFPLVHYHRDATTRVFVSPVAAYARGPHRAAGFVGPYFWYKDADLDASFIPFLHADVARKSTGERTRQYGLWFQLDGPGRKARVLFPFAGHYADAHERDTFVFPTFFHMRRDDGTSVDTLLPLFWRSSGGGRSTTIVTLWFDHRAPGTHLTGFVPLYFHARTEARTLTIVPPLLYVHHADHKADSEQIWWALLWRSREHDASHTVVFPLWWARQSNAGGYKVLFPLFWRFTDTKTEKASTFVGPLYWSSWGTGRTIGLLPVLWGARNRADGSGSTALMPVFYEAHGPDRFAFATLLFGFGHSPTTRFNYFGPLWISHTDVAKETSTHLIPPLLFFRRTKPDASFTTLLALFWRRTDVTSSTTLGLPLYYDFHDYTLSRTTVFLPLLLRHANEVEQSVTWLAPLFYRHSTPTSSTTVAFPLVWDFQRGTDRTTLVLPLFATWHRADHDATWVFPTIYRRTGLAPNGAPDGTWHTVVAPFYAAAVKRPGDYMWEVLGGLFGHESVGRNRYLKRFFMRFEQEPAPRAQTAWYSQPARTPRRQPVRGLSMNTW
ncbi:MAG: hypothetical protein JWM82_855 [Myxococcales bacterium]|nr:hypothetical protein [Myxococcales bacterium]